MDRFLSEGVSEQSALFRRPDTGQLSTNKGCLCARLIQIEVHGEDAAGTRQDTTLEGNSKTIREE